MNKAHFISEEQGGRKVEGDIEELLAIQDIKKGTKPDQFLNNPAFKWDGNFDLVLKDGEGNLKHLIVSNTDNGAKQVYKVFKAGPSSKTISITIGQHAYKLLSMDDGAGTQTSSTS